MTLKEIQDYKDSIEQDVTLFGFTSTSLKKEQALGFAWENKGSGHTKVLFHIKWKDELRHYYVNAGAFDHEEEVLLYDGTKLKVESVEDIYDNESIKSKNFT